MNPPNRRPIRGDRVNRLVSTWHCEPARGQQIRHHPTRPMHSAPRPTLTSQRSPLTMFTNTDAEPAPYQENSLPRGATRSRPTPADATLEFGQFRVLLRRCQLVADGMPIELGTRAFDLLLVLLDADRSLVTKGELLSRVWPGIVVAEDNLKVQISALPRLLARTAILSVPKSAAAIGLLAQFARRAPGVRVSARCDAGTGIGRFPNGFLGDHRPVDVCRRHCPVAASHDRNRLARPHRCGRSSAAAGDRIGKGKAASMSGLTWSTLLICLDELPPWVAPYRFLAACYAIWAGSTRRKQQQSVFASLPRSWSGGLHSFAIPFKASCFSRACGSRRARQDRLPPPLSPFLRPTPPAIRD